LPLAGLPVLDQVDEQLGGPLPDRFRVQVQDGQRRT
jgi:hypothetical protein